MVNLEFTLREDDGACWFEDGKIMVNLKWLYEWDAEDYISDCIIHEYIEHILGLGHAAAVIAEKASRGIDELLDKLDRYAELMVE